MKLVYTELDKQLVFQENSVQVLVVENKQLFRRMLEDFHKQLEGEKGGFTLSADNKILRLDKEAVLVLNPFNLEINSRKALTGLYNELGKLGMNEENYLKTCRLKGELAEYAYDLLNQVDYALEFQDDFCLQNLFKALEVQFVAGEGDFLEQIVAYMDVCCKFQKVKLLAFANLKTYVTDDELRELYKEAFYRKLHLLMFENHAGKELEDEVLSIVDGDLCLIK